MPQCAHVDKLTRHEKKKKNNNKKKTAECFVFLQLKKMKCAKNKI